MGGSKKLQLTFFTPHYITVYVYSCKNWGHISSLLTLQSLFSCKIQLLNRKLPLKPLSTLSRCLSPRIAHPKCYVNDWKMLMSHTHKKQHPQNIWKSLKISSVDVHDTSKALLQRSKTLVQLAKHTFDFLIRIWVIFLPSKVFFLTDYMPTMCVTPTCVHTMAARFNTHMTALVY